MAMRGLVVRIVRLCVSDKLVKPACGRRLAATLPNARLEIVGGGHMALYTHPNTIAEAVRALYPSNR